ncbi:hypothetical protein VTH06DRAFT_1785 [Thermothelomyces fergusii]
MDSKAVSTSSDQESQVLTAQAIQEIEHALGDVGRGGDFPMSSRARGGSTSSRDSGTGGVLPLPARPSAVPPVPHEHRQVTRQPDAGVGESLPLPLPRVRPSRHRGASTPDNARRQRSRAPTDGGRQGRHQIPVPFPPVLSPAPATSPTPTAPLQHRGPQTTNVPCETAQPVSGGGLRPARAAAATRPSAAPVYSVFPSIQPLPVSLAAPSRGSSSTPQPPAALSSHRRLVSPIWPNELCRPLRPRDLDPASPLGYPEPPPFLHNWDTPNRARAKGAVDAATAHRPGKIGPPVGSRPRPRPRPVPAVVVTSAAPADDPDPASATGGFAYSPMMSPHEAQISLDWSDHAAGARRERRGGGRGGGGSEAAAAAHARACRLPLLGHDELLLSAEEAAAAGAAGGRNTIFIDRGVDLGRAGRGSACGDNVDDDDDDDRNADGDGTGKGEGG